MAMDNEEATIFCHNFAKTEPEELFWKQKPSTGAIIHCAFDRLGKYCAMYMNWNEIELWDFSLIPLPTSKLYLPKEQANEQFGYCHNISWSYNAFNVIGVFGTKPTVTREIIQKNINLIIWNVSTESLIFNFRFFFFTFLKKKNLL
jgi:hypothetical protein